MAAIAAAAISAAGAIGGGIASAQGAQKAARAGRGRLQQVPLPPYADALNRYTARLVAANATQVAPTFVDWLKSGGQATFPLQDTGFTPSQAVSLGLVGHSGQPIPFVAANQSKLTPEQLLYLGQSRIRAANMSKSAPPEDPVSKYTRSTNILNKLEGEPQGPNRVAREQKIMDRKKRLAQQLGIG